MLRDLTSLFYIEGNCMNLPPLPAPIAPTIIPTVGCKVWYFEHGRQAEPHDATVIKVWATQGEAAPSSYVNLLVTDPLTGAGRLESSVKAGMPGADYRHYEWPPHQVMRAFKDAVVLVDRNYVPGL